MRIVLIAVLSILLSSCGTISSFGEQPTTNNGKAHGGCDCVPRVYGGSSIDVCVVLLSKWKESGEIVGLLLYDFPFSLVADTIVLPYSIYKQLRSGNNCPVQKPNKLRQLDGLQPPAA